MDLVNETFHIYGFNDDTKSIKEATTSLYAADSCLDYLNKNDFGHSFSIQDSFCYDDSSHHIPDFVSGSPIMIKEGNKYYQFGITTFGVLDRVKGQTIPALSSKLSNYQSWIIETITGKLYFI